MNSSHYDIDLSINDCLAALLGLNVEHFRSGDHDYLLDEIEQNLSYAVEAVERALPSHNSDQFDALLTRAEKASTQYSQAITFHTRIVGEIAKHRAGRTTDLVVTQDDNLGSGNSSLVRIDRQSFIDWSSNVFDIELAADDLSTIVQGEALVSGDDNELSENEREKLEVLIALLIEELAAAKGNQYSENGRLNYLQLAKLIEGKKKDQNVNISGLATQTLKKKFSNAVKTKDDARAKKK